MSDSWIVLTDNDYQVRLENGNGVLLFYKKLCPNCKALEKMLEKFFAANPSIPGWRVDSEESVEAMKYFGVERVPTVLLLKNGQVTARKVGLMNLREMFDFYGSI
jgi:thioredoxin 1